jgi:hypothetical protein
MGRQHDLLELLEPSPALTPAMRTAAIPMLAALLLEVATNPTTNMLDGRTTSTEAGDEQDRA